MSILILRRVALSNAIEVGIEIDDDWDLGVGTIELELKLMMIETLIYFYKPFVGMRLKLELKLLTIETLMWMNRWAK